MSKTNRIALIAAILAAAAIPASAAPSTGLQAGGFTIAGPASVALAATVERIVFTDASGNSDACVTVANTGRGAVQLSVTGNGIGTKDLAAGQTAALCRDSVEEVSLTCLATSPVSCAAQWRVDRD